MATPGKRQKRADGKLAKKTSGKVAKFTTGDENCCCEGGCEECADDIALTVSGLVLCDCVEIDIGVAWAHLVTDLNGVYTGFTRSEGDGVIVDCVFTKDIGPAETNFYLDDECDGTPIPNTDDGVQITIQHFVADGKWYGLIHLNNDAIIDNILAFVGKSAPDIGFTTSPVIIENTETCGYRTDADPHLSNWWLLAHDGQMEIEFICAE